MSPGTSSLPMTSVRHPLLLTVARTVQSHARSRAISSWFRIPFTAPRMLRARSPHRTNESIQSLLKMEIAAEAFYSQYTYHLGFYLVLASRSKLVRPMESRSKARIQFLGRHISFGPYAFCRARTSSFLNPLLTSV